MLNNYEQFIRDLINPEVFGFSCSQEVQDKARELLGIIQPTEDSLRYLVRSNKFPQPDVHTNSGLNVDCSRSRWSREPLLRYYRNM